MADSRLSFGAANVSQGRLFWRGVWSSLVTYNLNDAVAFSGSAYIALGTSLNVNPTITTSWDVMASGGSVSSVAGRTGAVVLVGADITDKDAALGVAGLDSSGFLKAAEFTLNANAQVGTTYAIASTDRGKLVTFSNASPVAVSIAQATGSFAAGWYTELININAGLVTVTATTSTIEGSATVTLKQWESVVLTSVGGNYVCLRSKVRGAFTDITGTVALAQGGTGVDLSAGGGTTMVLAQNASHVISARNLVAADIPSLAASIITSGALALARGGTAVDLSAGGGTTMVLAQDASHVVSARNLVAADIPSLASRTEVLTNKDLTGVTTGNKLSVLNAQGAVGPFTGNSTDQVAYTFTLLANTIDTSAKAVKIRVGLIHASGTVSTTLKIFINGVNAAIATSGTVASQSIAMEAQILRTGTTTGGSWSIAPNAGISVDGLAPFSQALTGLAWTSNQTITVTFNVAATDTWSGLMLMIEQIQ